jgi:hypothetical protein
MEANQLFIRMQKHLINYDLNLYTVHYSATFTGTHLVNTKQTSCFTLFDDNIFQIEMILVTKYRLLIWCEFDLIIQRP